MVFIADAFLHLFELFGLLASLDIGPDRCS